MNLRWLAAVLCPQDVALHPNFFSEEPVSCSSLLALVASASSREYTRATSSARVDNLPEAEGGGFEVLQAAEQSQSAGTVRAGAERLEVLLRDGVVSDDACAVAAALMAATAFGELDEHARAIALLQLVLDRAGDPGAAPAKRLLAAALLQQFSLREYELGVRNSSKAERVLVLLEGMSGAEFGRFKLSLGVSWTSARTVDSIIGVLRDAAESQRLNAQGFLTGEWRAYVTSQPVELLLRNQRNAVSGYRSFVKRAFERATGASPKVVLGSSSPDSEVYGSLLLYELSGSPAVRQWRTDLGALRYLASLGDGEPWARQDAIRLLRQGTDSKMLASAVRHTRSGGPLEALAADARQVMRTRLTPATLGTNELKVLESAAPGLEGAEASIALDGLLAARANQVDVPAGPGWRSWSVRVEEAWSAIVPLAQSAGRIDQIAALLLTELSSSTDSDELLDWAYARAARGISWDRITPATGTQWRNWLALSVNPTFEQVREVLSQSGAAPVEGLMRRSGSSCPRSVSRGLGVVRC